MRRSPFIQSSTSATGQSVSGGGAVLSHNIPSRSELRTVFEGYFFLRVVAGYSTRRTRGLASMRRRHADRHRAVEMRREIFVPSGVEWVFKETYGTKRHIRIA